MEEVIAARIIRVGVGARLAGCVCSRLEISTSGRVKMAYVSDDVKVGTGGKIDHLFRKRGAELTIGTNGAAPRTPLLSASDWERKARNFASI